jgi:MFS family permease
MRMFVHRPVLFANLAGLLVGFGMFALFIGVSYLAQMPSALTGYGFDASVLRAAVEFLLPSTIVSLLASPIGGQLVRHKGPRTVLVLASLVGAAGFALVALDHSHAASVIVAGILVGAGISLGYASMPAIIVTSVPPRQTGIANGINSIARSTGSAIGSAMITTVLASKTIDHLPPGVPALPAESQFTLSFVLAGVAFALVAVVAGFGLRHIHPLADEKGGQSTPVASSGDTAEGAAEPVEESTTAAAPETAEAVASERV